MFRGKGQVFHLGPMRVRVPEHGQPVEMTMYLSPEKALEQIGALQECLRKTVEEKAKANLSHNEAIKKLAKQQMDKVEMNLQFKVDSSRSSSSLSLPNPDADADVIDDQIDDPLQIVSDPILDVARVEAVENDPRMASWPPEWQLPAAELQVKLETMVTAGLGISIYYGKVAHGPHTRRPYGFRVTRKHNKFRRQNEAQLFAFTRYGGPEGARDAALAHIAQDEAEEARLMASPQALADLEEKQKSEEPLSPEEPVSNASPAEKPASSMLPITDGKGDVPAGPGIVTRGKRRRWVAEVTSGHSNSRSVTPEPSDSDEENTKRLRSESGPPPDSPEVVISSSPEPEMPEFGSSPEPSPSPEGARSADSPLRETPSPERTESPEPEAPQTVAFLD